MATLQADKDILSSKCDVLEEELYSSRLLLESQNTKMVEQLKGEIDEKSATISTLRSQLQSERANNDMEMSALKEQVQQEKDKMQAMCDEMATEHADCMSKLNMERDDMLQKFDQLQQKASIESSAYLEKLQKWEQKHREFQEVHRIGMAEKMSEIGELQAELTLQAEQNQMALQAVKDDQMELDSKLEKSKLIALEKEHTIETAKEEIVRLTGLLQDAKSQLSILTTENSDKDELSRLFKKRSENDQKEISALKKELSMSKQQLQANEDHRVLSQNSYITLEAELKVSKENCVDLEDTNVRLMKEIEILSSSHESQLNEKMELQGAVDSLTQEKEALKEEMMQAHSRSEKYRREVDEIKTKQLVSHTEEIERLQKEITSLQRNRDGLEVQREAITAANECHQEMIEGLKNEVNECQKSINLLTEDIHTANELNANLSTTIDNLEKTKVSYEHMMEEKDATNCSLKDKCHQHEEDLKVTTSKLYHLEQICEDLSNKLTVTSDMITDNENSNTHAMDMMKSEIALLQESLTMQKEDYDKVKTELIEAEKALEEKDNSMQTNQKEISELYSSHKRLETQLVEKLEIIDQFAMQVQALKVENETIKGDDEILKSMQVALDLHSNTVNSLTEELNEKNSLVEDMKQRCFNLENESHATATRLNDLDEKNLRAQAELEKLLRLKDESLQDTRKELIEIRDAYRALLTDQTSQKNQDAAGMYIVKIFHRNIQIISVNVLTIYVFLYVCVIDCFILHVCIGLTGLMDTLKELTEENKGKCIELGILQGKLDEQSSQLREYKSRYSEYKALGEQLTVDIEQISNENASIKRTLMEKESFFEVEKKQLERTIVDKKSELERLQEDAKSHTSLFDVLKEEKIKMESSLQTMHDERDKILKEFMDYRKEVTEGKTEADTSMAIRLQELHTELSTLESSYSEEVLAFKASNSKLQTELDKARNSTSGLEASVVAKSAAMKKLELEKDDLTTQMQTMESREKELSTLVVALTAESGQLQGQNEELQRQLERAYKRQEDVDIAVKSLDVELRKQLKQVEDERNSLTSQLASASKQIDIHVNTIDLLKADRPALTATVSKLQEEIDAGRTRMELLSKENKDLIAQNNDHSVHMEKLQEDMDKLRSTNEEFQDVQQQAAKDKEEILILKGTIKELQTQLNLSEQESIELSVELTSLKEQCKKLNEESDDNTNANKAYEKIMDENSILNDTVNELLCSNNDLKVSLNCKEEEFQALQQTNQNLIADLEASKLEIKELERSKNTLDEALMSMQEELGGLSKAMEGLVDMHELEEEREKHQAALQLVLQEKDTISKQFTQTQSDLKEAQDLIFELTNRLEVNNMNGLRRRDENTSIKTVATEEMKIQELNSTITELEGRLIARSRAEKQAMEVERALRDEIDILTQAQSKSSEKLKDAEKTIEQLRLSLDDFKEEDTKYRRVVADLQHAVIEYENQVSSLKHEIAHDNGGNIIDDYKGVSDGEIEATFTLNTEDAEENAPCERVEMKTNVLLALERLYEQQANASSNSSDYKQSWEQLYGIAPSSSPFYDNTKMYQLMTQVSLLQAELSTIQEVCLKKDDIIQRAQSIMAQLRDDSASKDTMVADLHAELHAKREECESLLAEVTSKENTYNQSRQQVLKLSTDIDDMNELLTNVQKANNTSVSSFETKLEDMTAAYQLLTQERDELQLTVKQSQLTQEELNISINDLKKSLLSKQEDMEKLEASNMEILSAMDMVSTALSEAQEREEEYAQTTTKLRTEIFNLQRKLADARGSNSDMFLSLEEKLHIATEQLVVAKSRTVHLEEQLAARNHELSSLREHYKTFSQGIGTSVSSSDGCSTSSGVEDNDEVLCASVESLDNVILSEIMDENARITQNCIESMMKRRDMRYKYTAILAMKNCNRVNHEDEEEDETLQGEVFVEQDSCASDIFNISADSIVVDT